MWIGERGDMERIRKDKRGGYRHELETHTASGPVGIRRGNGYMVVVVFFYPF